MIDLQGKTLQQEEQEILKHPLVGGVILFSRNYQSTAQLSELVASLHAARKPQLLIAVDHEGGRIQRFREGFTQLPPCALIGKAFDENEHIGMQLADHAGWVMAAELRAVGVDLSFAPVLDVHKEISSVIGDRSFHRDPEVVARLARAYVIGMRRAGMSAVGKHFPGHGSVVEDSHVAVPVDKRRFEDIQQDDMIAFERLVHAGLPGIMPAHVIYPAVDDRPAGFSSIWLKEILRGQLQFQGTVFSDDINMAGAEFAGDYCSRAHCALEAGCDMVLVCNNRDAVLTLLDQFSYSPNPASHARLIRMHGKQAVYLDVLHRDRNWQESNKILTALDKTPELDLGDDAI